MKQSIVLDDEDMRLCTDLAERRYKSNRTANVTNAKIGPQNNEFTDLNGIIGEFVLCKMFGLEFDQSISPRQGGVDCLCGDIDVKTTEYSSGKLLVRETKDPLEIDVYVLILGDYRKSRIYQYAGWIRSGDVHKSHLIRDLGYGPTYVQFQENLRQKWPPSI